MYKPFAPVVVFLEILPTDTIKCIKTVDKKRSSMERNFTE